MKSRSIGATLVALIALSIVAAPTLANGRPLRAELSGANELSGGDTDGSGVARLRLNQGRHRICYKIEVADIALPVTAAHIHEGAAGVDGAIVVEFGPFDEGTAVGCVTGLERSLIKAIRRHPADYYVNVHNDEFPDGAVRGQLEPMGAWPAIAATIGGLPRRDDRSGPGRQCGARAVPCPAGDRAQSRMPELTTARSSSALIAA